MISSDGAPVVDRDEPGGEAATWSSAPCPCRPRPARRRGCDACRTSRSRRPSSARRSAAVAAPTRRPKMSWNSIRLVARLASARLAASTTGPSARPGAARTGRRGCPRPCWRRAIARNPIVMARGDAGADQPVSSRHRPQEDRQREHRADGDAAQQAAGRDDHPAIVIHGPCPWPTPWRSGSLPDAQGRISTPSRQPPVFYCWCLEPRF